MTKLKTKPEVEKKLIAQIRSFLACWYDGKEEDYQELAEEVYWKAIHITLLETISQEVKKALKKERIAYKKLENSIWKATEERIKQELERVRKTIDRRMKIEKRRAETNKTEEEYKAGKYIGLRYASEFIKQELERNEAIQKGKRD